MATDVSTDNTDLFGRELGSYDDLPKAREAWDIMVETDDVSYQDIWRWVLTIDDAGYETIPQSMGFSWIVKNPKEFARVVPDMVDFIEKSLFEASRKDGKFSQLGYYLLKGLFNRPEILGLVPAEYRLHLLQKIIGSYGGFGWIRSAFICGIKRNDIALIILDRLERTRVETGMANDVRDFLQYGNGGRHGLGESEIWTVLRKLGVPQYEISATTPRATTWPFQRLEKIVAQDNLSHDDTRLALHFDVKAWWVLTELELIRALMICADKEPGQTLRMAEIIRGRLDDTMADRIMAKALEDITTLAHVPLAELDRLPIAVRVRIAKGIEQVKEHYAVETAARFLLKIVLDLGQNLEQDAGIDFLCSQVERVLPANKHVSTVYRSWRRMKLDHPWLENILRDALKDNGYAIGQIAKGTFTHRKSGQTRVQMQVVVNDTTYIHDNYDHRYWPAEDDIVVFKTAGTHLTPKVVATHMVPLFKDIS